MINYMAKGLLLEAMEINMKDNGLMIKYMEKGIF